MPIGVPLVGVCFIRAIVLVVLPLFRKVIAFFANKCQISDFGKFGEDVVCKFLKGKGYNILKRNWTFKRGEIDIIAIDNSSGNLVFIEVKLRDASAFIPGYFCVTKKKKAILRRTCKAFIRQFATQNASYRFDVAEVALNKSDNSYEISHYENVSLF